MTPPPHGLFTDHGGPALPEFRIGLGPIEEAAWFEGGEADPGARKAALYAAHPELTWGEVDGSRPAQAEAAAMVGRWLNTKNPLPHFAGTPPSGGEPPLRAAALLVSDDLCLMERRAEGWTLTAASLCAPSFFSAKEAVGKPLQGLHAPVPGFNDHLLARVSRIFDHLADDAILERRNWTVVNSADLFQPDATPYRARLPAQAPDEIADSLVVRRERQSIRRMPATGAVLFTIRIWREPLADLFAEPNRRAAFAAAWEAVMSEKGASFRGYKRLDLFDAAVRRRLARFADAG